VTFRAVDLVVMQHALAQHGAFSRSQVLADGGTDDLIRRRREAGTWITKADGVYALPAVPPSWMQSLWIACLATSVGAVVSHEGAAALHGLATFRPGPVVVTVPHGDSRLDGLAVVHQSRNLPDEHVVAKAGLPVTSVARTIADLATFCRRARLDFVIDDTVAAKLVTDEELLVCCQTVARRGRLGSRMLRSILAQRSPGETPPDGRFEALLLRVLRRGGLPRPVLQYPLPGRERPEGIVDAVYVEERIIIECDSRRYHTRKRDFAVDRERDIVSTLAGWRTLRFTWDDLTKRPAWVIDCVRRALDQRAA